MATTPAYSTLFSCLYDEPGPIGHPGWHTHYSVMRSVEWLDVTRTALERPQIHDFAVIWDEDHDTRVIEVAEALYMAGLLSPVQFIGEHKGTLTVIVAAKFYFWHDKPVMDAYYAQLSAIASSPNHGDGWPVELGFFDRSPGSIHQTDLKNLIGAGEHRDVTYVRNIDSLWGLGTKPFAQRTTAGLAFAQRCLSK